MASSLLRTPNRVNRGTTKRPSLVSLTSRLAALPSGGMELDDDDDDDDEEEGSDRLKTGC
jgi:hypothetical protein